MFAERAGDAPCDAGNFLVVIRAAELVDGETSEAGEAVQIIGVEFIVTSEEKPAWIFFTFAVAAADVLAGRNGSNADRFDGFHDNDTVDGIEPHDEADVGPGRTGGKLNEFGERRITGAEPDVAGLDERAEFRVGFP